MFDCLWTGRVDPDVVLPDEQVVLPLIALAQVIASVPPRRFRFLHKTEYWCTISCCCRAEPERRRFSGMMYVRYLDIG